MISKNLKTISKEGILDLTFPSKEVLPSEEAQSERRLALFKATGMGNLEHRKVHITFEDAEGLKQVHTTIWAVSDRKVMLKNGRAIPVHRIHAIQF